MRRLHDEDFEVAANAALCDLSIIADRSALASVSAQLMKKAMDKLHRADQLAEQCATRLAMILSTGSDMWLTRKENDVIVFQLIEHLFPYCSHQCPVSLQIAKGLQEINHPVARSIAEELQHTNWDERCMTREDIHR